MSCTHNYHDFYACTWRERERESPYGNASTVDPVSIAHKYDYQQVLGLVAPPLVGNPQQRWRIHTQLTATYNSTANKQLGKPSATVYFSSYSCSFLNGLSLLAPFCFASFSLRARHRADRRCADCGELCLCRRTGAYYLQAMFDAYVLRNQFTSIFISLDSNTRAYMEKSRGEAKKMRTQPRLLVWSAQVFPQNWSKFGSTAD